MSDQNKIGAYAEKFKTQWEEVTTKLINSGYDLSKIKLTKEVSDHDTRASKRSS